MAFELKTLSPEAVPRALAKAERYRLLNEPGEAESICLDALEIEPDNQEALATLLLALTEQFGDDAAPSGAHALEIVARMHGEYERAYYTGIVYERETRAYLERKNVVRSAAYDGFRHAMEWYERAEALRPPGNVDAVLRWNSCARAIERERLEPEAREPELPLE